MPMPHPSDEYDPVATAEPAEPPPTTFWRLYNRPLEFPIATLLSVFAHLGLVAGLVGIILLSMSRSRDKEPVPISLVDNGMDDAGKGNPNEGGAPDAISNGDNAPTKADYEQL